MTEKPKIENGTVNEMETFLPKDNSAVNGVTKYTVTKARDFEAAGTDYDPFKDRNLEHPVSDRDTLTHLLKASLGTGILSMPAAFQSSGLVLGIFATVLVSVICTHCSYILVVCAHELYKRTGKNQMSFAEVAEESCRKGPKWARVFALPAKTTVLQGIFVTYFATCSCYAVIVARNINYVLGYYLNATATNVTAATNVTDALKELINATDVANLTDIPDIVKPEPEAVSLRITIALLLLPLILLAYVPNLKYLAPFSMVANFCMAVGLGITFYYLVVDMPTVSSESLVGSIEQFPVFFSITVFAIEAIGVVMPLENHMKTPQHFTGLCGVLNQGMSGVTLVYILLGFFGYLKYGSKTQGSITLNLPIDEYAAQTVNILIAIAVFFTFGLQFYVCLDIAWNGVKDRFTKHPIMAQYILRTVMVVICVSLAIAVPTIIPFVSLIGAFCFSILGLMVPVAIEMLTFWEKGFGKYNWKLAKNVIIVIIAIMALIFGSKSAIQDIIKMYTTKD